SRTGRYVGYTKTFAPVRGFLRRCIGVTAATDFEHWPPAELILTPDDFDDRWITEDNQRTEFYGLTAFPYESMYIGFLWIFRITDGRNDGPIFCELISRREGVNWDCCDGERIPVLCLGSRCAWASGLVHTINLTQVVGATT